MAEPHFLFYLVFLVESTNQHSSKSFRNHLDKFDTDRHTVDRHRVSWYCETDLMIPHITQTAQAPHKMPET